MKKHKFLIIALTVLSLIAGLSHASDNGNARSQSFSKVKKVLTLNLSQDCSLLRFSESLRLP